MNMSHFFHKASEAVQQGSWIEAVELVRSETLERQAMSNRVSLVISHERIEWAIPARS